MVRKSAENLPKICRKIWARILELDTGTPKNEFRACDLTPGGHEKKSYRFLMHDREMMVGWSHDDRWMIDGWSMDGLYLYLYLSIYIYIYIYMVDTFCMVLACKVGTYRAFCAVLAWKVDSDRTFYTVLACKVDTYRAFARCWPEKLTPIVQNRYFRKKGRAGKTTKEPLVDQSRFWSFLI